MEVAGRLIEFLSQPAKLVDPGEFAKTLAQERPAMYGALATDLVFTHRPQLIDRGLSAGRLASYTPEDRAQIYQGSYQQSSPF